MSVSHLPVRPPSIKAREELTENGSASTKVSKSIRILQMSLLDLQIVYVHGSASELRRKSFSYYTKTKTKIEKNKDKDRKRDKDNADCVDTRISIGAEEGEFL